MTRPMHMLLGPGLIVSMVGCALEPETGINRNVIRGSVVLEPASLDEAEPWRIDQFNDAWSDAVILPDMNYRYMTVNGESHTFSTEEGADHIPEITGFLFAYL